MKPQKKSLLTTIILLVLVAAGTAYWWLFLRFFETTDNAYVRGDITAISSGANGEITQVFVRENQQVQAGDLLVLIDQKSFQARLKQAQTKLALAAASTKSLDEKIKFQNALMREAEADLQAAQAEYDRARNEWERMNQLGRKGYAARRDLDITWATLHASEAAVNKARASADASRQRRVTLIADHGRLRAERDAALAAINLAELDLDYTEVRAPIDGVVADVIARPGLRLPAGARLLTIVPLTQLWVEAIFKETQIGRMKPGQRVTLKVDAFPDLPLQAEIESLSPASGAEFALLPPENATGNFIKVVQRLPVRIALPDRHALAGLLRPGLSVRVEVDVHPQSQPLVEKPITLGATE